MKTYTRTMNWQDDSEFTPGYVYLVFRPGKKVIKIGSTVYSPAWRIGNEDGFVMAARTTAVRQLEDFLHKVFRNAGRKAAGWDNFVLTTDDIRVTGKWFCGGRFNADVGGDGGILALADYHGRIAATPHESSQMIEAAVRAGR